jgi:Flp pilus assembly protein TadD
LVQLERRQEAVAQYRLAIAANACDADAEHDLGAALNGGNTSSSPAALPHYRRAALLEPNNPVYLNDLGDLLHDMNRRKEAQKQYLLAASTTRAESDMYWQRAYALFQLNRNEAALVQVRLGAAVNPDDDRVEHLWGDVEAGLGHRDDAMVHYRRAISLQPNNPAHHNALGSQLLDTGRPRETCEAMEQFRQAVATIGSWSWMADERNKALEQLKADVGGCEKTGQSATRPQVQ